MNASYKGILVVALLATAVGLSACKSDGPAEKAGQKVDSAVEQAGKKIDKATDEAGKKIEKAGAALSDKSKQAGDYMDDSAITAKVMAEIANDSLLKMHQITVVTTNGAVSLNGVVDSRQALDRAGEIARSVKHVQSVDNKLVVKSAN